MPSFGLSNARAEASRRNGAKSRGPKTADGKARSAQNALKHGLRAQKYLVLPEEDAATFAAHEAALMEELAPQGALQAVLAQRIVAATWRLSRAERLEKELFAENGLPDGTLGLALIRDGNRARAVLGKGAPTPFRPWRSFVTLLRYRGGALAEFWRALRTLKALQAEDRANAQAPARAAEPNEPKRRRIPRDSSPDRLDPAPAWLPQPLPTPEPAPLPAEQGKSALLAGTALALGRCSGG